MGNVGFIIMDFIKVNIWEEMGMLAFARFYDLTMEETITMINKPNDTLHEMTEEMKQSMMRYEDFMVKVKRADEEGVVWTRSDILDLS